MILYYIDHKLCVLLLLSIALLRSWGIPLGIKVINTLRAAHADYGRIFSLTTSACTVKMVMDAIVLVV